MLPAISSLARRANEGTSFDVNILAANPGLCPSLARRSSVAGNFRGLCAASRVGSLSLPCCQSFLTIARECVSQVETTPLGGLGLVNIENDAVQKRTLLRDGWGPTQTGCLRLIGEATPATVRPALDLSNDAVQRELAELLA